MSLTGQSSPRGISTTMPGMGVSAAASTPGSATVDTSLASLRAGLRAAANRDARDGLTVIAMTAPVIDAAALVEAFGDEVCFAWSPTTDSAAAADGATAAGGTVAIVGVGVARELRGHGDARWSEIVRQARALAIDHAVSNGDVVAVDALGTARPRWVGGAAFAPGSADHAPWTGFGDAWFALPRWTYVNDRSVGWLVLAIDGRDATDATRWEAELARFRAVFAHPVVTPGQPDLVEHQPDTAAEWRTRVTAITDAIAHGTVSKVVAARQHGVTLAGRVRPAALLAALDERHVDTTRVLVRPPGAGALIAATPEQLVRRAGDVVTCDALAGTARIPDDALIPGGRVAAAAGLFASAKDRREHALVVDAIRAALEGAGAKVEAPPEPGVKPLRHVLHLHTPFRATLTAPTHVLELAARLHPTPAMGGTPTPVAVQWIREHEPARGWYASPVGWFDLDGNGELVVAIRSGVIVGPRAHLWAGAGIVAGSDPDRELGETELKLCAMLGALGSDEPAA